MIGTTWSIEVLSKGLKKWGEGSVILPGYLSFISYQISLQLLHPPSTKWHTSLMLLVALWKIRPQWSKNNHSFQHFTSSGDALHSSISVPLQSHMMILSITYLFSAGEVQKLKRRRKRQEREEGAPSCHKHTSKSDICCAALICSTVWLYIQMWHLQSDIICNLIVVIWGRLGEIYVSLDDTNFSFEKWQERSVLTSLNTQICAPSAELLLP